METSVSRSLRHWWVFLLRGILFILVGIYMIAFPVSSLIALGFLFGLIIFFAGGAELMYAIQDRGADNRGWHLFIGIIDIILGIMLMIHVTASVTILGIIVGIWFIIRGFSLLSFSRAIGRSWMLVAGGILTILFGLLILFNPLFGATAIILWIAIAFIIVGVFNIMLGIRLKSVLK
ncbi:MAG TPA: DUF308 domain-containing protein [Mucilaginibacter sp.]|jgi:uncharacterized membrane protein HdeD (DUF308 family)